ncbi:M1 family metallopeptidase [Marivirga arenosa]|uniref:M1 family metallopeptidase n=1 Tax=Marivirga arenosa TaxID=3059076 RepID=A0AA51N9B1_9BACT|nr:MULTISPECIES: M1 family metallopeptidase [unclassified Marivirga]WMN06885.1 M1 family metallopeptidase [Marivirga sp. ABR2-2]WNB16796.1 M1 family metallopeptidase [Marivirga sp. BKB1-2]
MKLKFLGLVMAMLLTSLFAFGQTSERWQQAINYEMEIDMDVESHQFDGKQKATYTNNSPDQLNKVFYHLYFNAFQPNSMMDVRSRTIKDPDRRVMDRISKLSEDEIGYQKIKSLKQDGKDVKYEVVGTILEVDLNEPIEPGETVEFDMEFEGQVPVQIRRSGRDNAEGVSYSMAQWYPRMSEYDYQGWHSNPYIGREFHGIWGDFDVKITIDEDYVLGGTGYIQNPEEVGHGYQKNGTEGGKGKKGKLTWHFKAPKVIDFMWAADPDFKHTKAQVPNGPELHFLYQENDKTKENWEKLPEYTVKAFEYMNKTFGKYPYDQFSVIQGGDGGMEYPMSTLITGERSLGSLVGVTVHEMFHSWYQGVLATNESLYEWMDEGFTSFGSAETMNVIMEQGQENPQAGNYRGYLALAESGIEEPMSTHADHYMTNFAYGRAAYSKGATFLGQLRYIIGEETFYPAMRTYFNTWKFKHPNDNDFIRIMEKASGLELDWYKEYWVYSTKQIDYGIESVMEKEGKSFVTLKKVGNMPMPLEVSVSYNDGSSEVIYIPLRIMRGEKSFGDDVNVNIKADWPWVYPTYTFELNKPASEIKSMVIDENEGMADVDRSNNVFDAEKHLKATFE